ncbi:hypothetical protein DV738_g4074, partial [Chaetothyriales sp. CBS 135597]
MHAMDPGKEHIATLCAAGTLGIAATGLALGTDSALTWSRPGKRKSPGADVSYSPDLAASASTSASHSSSSRRAARKSRPETDRISASETSLSQSRASSLSRRGRRPLTQGKDASSVSEDARPRSSWLRRMSTSWDTSRPTSWLSVNGGGGSSEASTSQTRFDRPNRLVKRSTSPQFLYSDHPPGRSWFRRPATSHQRSASCAPATIAHVQGIIEQPSADVSASWSPFFRTGYASSSRSGSAMLRDAASIRTVSASNTPRPTLVNGTAVHTPRQPGDESDFSLHSSPELRGLSTQRRNKLRKTGRAYGKTRNFTEPSTAVFKQDVHASSLSFGRPSPLASGSQSSTFDLDSPTGAPVFPSSPVTYHTARSNLVVNKRSSETPSDPNTLDSESDARVFSDDDYMDFRSDTAYDSLATRATASSHSGFRQPKIETIFDEPSKEQLNGHGPTLEALMQRTSLSDHSASGIQATPQWLENVGIDPRALDQDKGNARLTPPVPTTPERESWGPSWDKLNATPLANATRRLIDDATPSSPANDSIDWSPKSTRDDKKGLMQQPGTPPRAYVHQTGGTFQDSDSAKRSSIFDWSEQQKSAGEATNGMCLRPKTVHGNQGEDGPRSRASGRKERNVAHLRSQSVPVNRESGVDVDGSATSAKFSTWGLGHKPVSEEWSEDFEFDDVEEIDEAQVATLRPVNRDSIRSVRVPQSIIDRQASVHLQFGQVQEFMALVEELKRLRMQGASLGLLNGQSRQLWEDAENIINLATLNNEDEPPFQSSSPTASDFFGEDSSPSSRRISAEESRQLLLNPRVVSNPVTPPTGRPRGESLAQARNFLQTIQQQKSGPEGSPAEAQLRARAKMPFDTQDLRKLVERAGVITRALKEIVRKAEGVSVSPQRLTPHNTHDHTLSHIFNPPDASPTPSYRRAALPDSRSANSFLGSVGSSDGEDRPPSRIHGHAAAAPPPHKAHGDHGSSAGAGHHGEHDDGHEHHEDHYDPPGGWLWGVRPGEKYEKEGWERIFTWFYILPIVVGTIFYVNKEDTTIQTWALEEARRRLDKEGLLTDPFPKGVPNTHAKQTGHD